MSARAHVLVLERVHPDGIDRLRAASLSVAVELGLRRADVLERVRHADAIVVRSVVRVDEELLTHARQLRVVGRAGVGTDNIDLVAAAARNVAILTTPGGNADAGADFTLMQILCLVRNAYKAHEMMAIRDFRRDLLTGRDLCALTVGIVGLGHVGGAVAKRLRGFGCRLIGLDPRVTAAEHEALGVEQASGIDQMIADVDVLTLHVPLTPETRHLIGASQLLKARPGLVLINTSRAPVIDEEALVHAVREGRVAGVALDVFDEEPPFDSLPGSHGYDHRLLQEPGIVGTPHMGANTVEAQRNIALSLASRLIVHLNASPGR